MGVTDQRVEKAWRTIESRSARVDLLRAIGVVAGAIEYPGDPSYHRLQGTIRSADATVVRAIERHLLLARRRVHASRPPPDPALLVDVRRRLQAPDSMDRLVTIQDCLQQEVFAAAPVLAERTSVETDTMALVVLARAIGVLGSTAQIPLLAELSRHPVAAVRAGAVEGLRHQPDAASLGHLLERLVDGDDQVRRLAHEGLSSVDPDDLVATLRALPPTSTPAYLLPALDVLSPWRRDPDVDSLLARLEAWPDDDVARRADELRADQRLADQNLSSWA